MAKIIINNSLEVKGKVSITREKDIDENNIIILKCTGALSTHLYIDEIDTIETERFIIHNVDVFRESMGSDDYNIIYEFSSDDVEMKGIDVKIDDYSKAYFIITPQEMDMIEEKMYKNEHPFLGDIGEEYKDCIENKEKEEDN